VEHVAKHYYHFILQYANESSSILILLASLGLIVGVFTITGWILKLFSILIGISKESPLLLFVMSYLVGIILGMGLPPTATYVILSVLILPVFYQLGINPWIAQMFAFYIATLGEVTPPVAPAAVVAARIAREDFVKVGFTAMNILAVLFLVPFIILIRNSFIINPGLDLNVFSDILIILIAGLGLVTAFFSRISSNSTLDRVLRFLLIPPSLLLVFNLIGNNYINLSLSLILTLSISYAIYVSLRGRG
jgi:TRAP-type uncharacterized transport system fused permease subunit